MPLSYAEKSELSSLLAARRGVLNQITSSMSQRDMNPVESKKVDDLYTKVAELDQRIAQLENAQSADIPASDPNANNMVASGGRSMGRLSQPWPIGNNSRTGSDSDILRAWLRHGLPCEQDRDRETLQNRGYNPSANALEFRANLSAGGSGAGAELVPQSFYAEVQRAWKNVAPLRGICKLIQSDSGETLRIPINDDTSNTGSIIAENAEHTALDMSFTEIILSAYTYSSRLVKCSNELLQDTGIDLAAFLGQQLGERIGRAQEAHFLTGTGSSQPQGVITAASTTTAASATAITINDLITLMNAVDPAYKNTGGKVAFVMHQTVWSALRKLQDSQGRQLISDIQAGQAPELFGYPVLLTSGMDSTFVATKKTVLFGNFDYYAIRDAANLVVARSADRFFEFNQTAFLALQRTDAKCLNASAFRVLVH